MSQAFVANIKAELEAAGVNLSGPCGAFEVTKRVAWRLRTTGAGLLFKPSGNNCDRYAVDIIAYPDGRIVDILTDAGGTNGPTWHEGEPVDPARYRMPFDPDPVPIPGPPVPNPGPPPVDLEPVMLKLRQIETALIALLGAAGQPPPVYKGKVLGWPVTLRPEKE